MKKQILTVMAITIGAVCIFAASSCSKEDNSDSNKGYCYCTARDSYGYTDSDTVWLSEWGARNCNELTSILARNTPGVTFSCR